MPVFWNIYHTSLSGPLSHFCMFLLLNILPSDFQSLEYIQKNVIIVLN
jgi:hypothetical protein